MSLGLPSFELSADVSKALSVSPDDQVDMARQNGFFDEVVQAYEPFEPDFECEKLRKKLWSGVVGLKKRVRHKARREIVAEYKAELTNQQLGLGQLVCQKNMRIT